MSNSIPDHLDIRAFGAVGDGSADCTAAVQAALDAGATLLKPVLIPKGRFKIVGSLELAGGTSLNRIIGANEYFTGGGPADLQSSLHYTGSQALFVGKTRGTASAPTQTRLMMKGVAAYASNPAAVLFDYLDLAHSHIAFNWFRTFAYGIKGKLTLLTKVEDNIFLQMGVSAISNTSLTGGAKSMSDCWIRRNYLNGALASTNTVLIDIFYPALMSIADNFLDFGVTGIRVENGESYSVSGNQFDYCPTGLQLKNAIAMDASHNRFTHINKTEAVRWASPTTAMTNDNWSCIDILLGSQALLLDGNIATIPDRFITMRQSSYTGISERGSVVGRTYAGPMIDMTGRVVGAAPDGERLSFESMELADVAELPLAPEASYDGHRVYYNNALVRNVGGTWFDTAGQTVT